MPEKALSRFQAPKVLAPIGYLDIIGHSHAADGGSSLPDFGASHKIDGMLQPATYRQIAMGGAITSWHDQGNGALGDGGWARVAQELDRQEQISGFLATTIATTAPSAGATTVTLAAGAPTGAIATSGYFVVGQGASVEVVNASVSSTTLTLNNGTTLANGHAIGDPVYWSTSNTGGYLPRSQVVVMGYGANDLPVLGPFARGVFGTDAGASRGLVPLLHAFRFALAVCRCSIIYRDTHPACVYGANWTSSPVASSASWPPTYAFGPVNNQNYHFTSTPGSTVTFSTEPNFPGGTVDIFFTCATAGLGALWNIGVTGATTRTTNSAIDTRNINAVNQNDVAAYSTSSGRVTGAVYRLTGLSAGVNTITLTAATINTSASFLGWGVEAPQPPFVICTLDPREISYAIWGGWSYTVRSPRNAAVQSTQTATVAAGSSAVTLGTAITIGTTVTASTAVQIGDTITIGASATQETRRIASITDTTHVVVDANFVSAHTGEACSIGFQDADIVGGGYINLSDTQGAISVPGLQRQMQTVINEFDTSVVSLNVDAVLNGGPGSTVKNAFNFYSDQVHYSDAGHALLTYQIYQTLINGPINAQTIAKATVPMKRTWTPVYGDPGATPASNATPVFVNNFTNAYGQGSTGTPKTAFYKDMRTRAVYLRGAVMNSTIATPFSLPIVIFTLPVGYRPSAIIPVTAWSGSGPAVVEIGPDGNVYLTAGYAPGASSASQTINILEFNGSWLAEA